jgi:hypothetical protein
MIEIKWILTESALAANEKQKNGGWSEAATRQFLRRYG